MVRPSLLVGNRQSRNQFRLHLLEMRWLRYIRALTT